MITSDVNPVASLMFVNDGEIKVVVYNCMVISSSCIAYSPVPFRLYGLATSRKYYIQEINLYPKIISTLNSSTIFSGDFLIKDGYNPDMIGSTA